MQIKLPKISPKKATIKKVQYVQMLTPEDRIVVALEDIAAKIQRLAEALSTASSKKLHKITKK